jgi:hypothetical protein
VGRASLHHEGVDKTDQPRMSYLGRVIRGGPALVEWDPDRYVALYIPHSDLCYDVGCMTRMMQRWARRALKLGHLAEEEKAKLASSMPATPGGLLWAVLGVRSQVVDDGLGDGMDVGGATDMAGAGALCGGGFDGGVDSFGLVVKAEVVEHHGGAADAERRGLVRRYADVSRGHGPPARAVMLREDGRDSMPLTRPVRWRPCGRERLVPPTSVS